MYVLGTALVVIYHTYFLPFFTLFSSNGANLGTYLKDFEFTLIVTMGISIEAYFLFSGLLLVYPRFRRNQKNVQINVIKIIVRRYIRLCPSLLFILGIIVVLPLVGSGPVWTDIFDKAADNARKWWWTYVLMFNNFLAVKDQTFLYLWFIPCLMQISIIGAFLAWLMGKFPKFGMCIIIATGVACNIALGVLTALRNYPPTYAIYYYHNREHFEETIYTSPLSHVFSYGIGMLLGYFMAKNPTLKFSKAHVIFGWIAALFLMVGVQFIAYAGRDGTDPHPILAAVYAATHRTGFSIGLAWTILACTYGYGGVVGKFFSWKGFGPLSKLGYFGYLIHYIVITYHVSNARSSIVFSHYENWMRISGYTLVTFFAAYVLYITFESPLTYIESLFLPSRPSNEDLQNNIKQNDTSDELIRGLESIDIKVGSRDVRLIYIVLKRVVGNNSYGYRQEATCLFRVRAYGSMDKQYFLQFHAVIKLFSTTTKLRIVFDSSCKAENDTSMDFILEVGPKLQRDIFEILLNFRFPEIVITTAIENIYSQILVADEDQSYQQIIWGKNSSEDIRTYKLKTVTYDLEPAYQMHQTGFTRLYRQPYFPSNERRKKKEMEDRRKLNANSTEHLTHFPRTLF
ncbi:nose resistant to fluoxetine protein 6 [Nephila pilipes]|uniref:Nose resistant to fluoxetine protein 6 n=1 Tax=Nephila pilipes TaxID=299642 RepID=A0A8X6TI32_NEPPI|nr:nose resistant to fluoxetine protein 6 [Nephila pilipes]